MSFTPTYAHRASATRAPYAPPRILWEQRFIALAQVSVDTPMCIPGQDPRCTP
ncbi:MAG: hypothetical protein JNK82_24045 [Myxococcaceae bacterium]|nr:hypothetical protein [Myxococcaceae bacterium]